MSSQLVRAQESSRLREAAPRRTRALGLLSLGVVLALGAMLARGPLSAFQAQASPQRAAAPREEGVAVALVRPKLSQGARSLSLPGSIEGSEEAVLYPRADGYVRRWLVDMGDEVVKGQLLAEIDTPELDREVEQARAALAQAAAATRLAQATRDHSISSLKRFQLLGTRNLISKQELEQHATQASVDEAKVALAAAAQVSARASAGRLEQLKAFSRVTAPFSGTITARNIERGSLVSAGSATPMFRLANLDVVRVFLDLPQSLSLGVKQGLAAHVRVAEQPQRVFEGKVARSSGTLDVQTRTLRVEIRVDNPQRELLSGMYASVELDLESARPGWVVPATALISGSKGTRVAVLQDGRAHLVPVHVERDNGSEVEISQTFGGDLELVANPGPSLTEGTLLRRAL